jgi:transposase-like protein
MTNMTKDLEVVLKTDERGRVRMPAEKRERLLDEFERSGLSGAKFAALVGVKYPTFAFWVQRRRRVREVEVGKAVERSAASVQWLEAVVQEAGGSAPLKLYLPGGAWIELAQAAQVAMAAALVRALAKPC